MTGIWKSSQRNKISQTIAERQDGVKYDLMDEGGRAKQEPEPRAVQDNYMDVIGRAKQDARAEHTAESARTA